MSRRFRRCRRFLYDTFLCPTDFTDLHRFFYDSFFLSRRFRRLRRFFFLPLIRRSDLFGRITLIFSCDIPKHVLSMKICVTSLMSFCHADSADFADFSRITLLNQMKNNLRHPIDRTGLNLCKSVKSVGLHIMQFRFHDRTGRFPFKFRA